MRIRKEDHGGICLQTQSGLFSQHSTPLGKVQIVPAEEVKESAPACFPPICLRITTCRFHRRKLHRRAEIRVQVWIIVHLLWDSILACPDCILLTSLVVLLRTRLGTASSWHTHSAGVEHLTMSTSASSIGVVTRLWIDIAVVTTTVAVSRGGGVARRGPAGSAHVRTAYDTSR